MFDTIFTSAGSPTVMQLLISIGASVLSGLIIALVYRVGTKFPSRNLTAALVILPAVVQVVIMLVNGNVGAGVAVMGAFSLVRFRSVPGTSRDIIMLFFAMAAGLATGMGYIFFALVFVAVIGIIFTAAEKLIPKAWEGRQQLKITIPEDLDYSGVFDDIFEKYTSYSELIRVKTTNMGTMYELVYHISQKDASREKAMLDEIRCRNGNLTVVCGMIPVTPEEL
ncbi:MAG: DUF4956 domain-containing protein [Oscillospiraceae bacterium]